MKVNFVKTGGWKQELIQAYTFRHTLTPDFTQADDHISTAVNPDHPEGYDNISLLSKETYHTGVQAKLTCAFEGLGCPEIILVENTEDCADGAVRYGACFEVVLWKNGVNVWRHYMREEDHHCYWHKHVGLTLPIKEGCIHELEVQVIRNYICFGVDGVSVKLRTEDLPERFNIGVTACEGIVHLHELQIEQGEDNSSEDQVS